MNDASEHTHTHTRDKPTRLREGIEEACKSVSTNPALEETDEPGGGCGERTNARTDSCFFRWLAENMAPV